MSQIPSSPQAPSFSGGAAASGVEYGAAANTPVGSTPVDSGQTDLPDYTQAGDEPQIGSEEGYTQQPTPGQQQQQQQPDAVAQELQSLSHAFGQDFTGFSSVQDARNAARIIAEQHAQRGLQQGGWGVGQPQQQQPQQQFPQSPGSVFDHAPQPLFTQPQQPFQIPAVPGQQAGPELDIDFGDLTDVDPKVKAGIEKLKQTAQQAMQQSQQLVAGVQKQFVESQKAQVRSRAHAALDTVNSPKYGQGQAKNSTQIIARQNIERLVNSIVDGMVLNGTPVPQIENVVQMAVLIDSGFVPGQAGQQQQQQQTPAHAMKPTSQQAGPRTLNLTPKRPVNPNYDPLGLLNDDDFRRGLQEIAAKY